MRARWRVGPVLVLAVVVLVTLAASTPSAAPTGQAALTLSPSYPDSAPYEDVRLKP
jgi:hypothetical protein